MCGHTAKDERRQEGERHDEGVEETVVALAHTVPHPRTVMVESLWKRGDRRRRHQQQVHLISGIHKFGKCMLFKSVLDSWWRRCSLFITGKCQGVVVRSQLTHAVVTQAAVGGARRSEHLAGEAVLELHHLVVDEDFLGARRRPVAGASGVVCRTKYASLSGDDGLLSRNLFLNDAAHFGWATSLTTVHCRQHNTNPNISYLYIELIFTGPQKWHFAPFRGYFSGWKEAKKRPHHHLHNYGQSVYRHQLTSLACVCSMCVLPDQQP